ncbi:MAG: restriction endonuclease [Candidatus Neomarinimicrobiota bacterium]|jgi:restriction system protein|uniref:Restriction endonuclease type IV Mrr domain-containing protein n=1 Tax=marine metagenome TaxID=408172 RepID=A0A381TCS5_9ZZZZ|nr:restriction endonuclease [Candidatus Neomarinimicrobiota bacterium]|tara:strand:+ start:398 stop:1408 length:1011 start_codon:yes stop_codon:yes gene_type:complete
MSLWVVRGGKFGEYENRFINESKIYITRDGFNIDLNKLSDKAELRIKLDGFYPNQASMKLTSWSDQIWSFVHEIQEKDWIVIPSKLSPVLHVGKVTGAYVFDKNGDDPYFHSKEIQWTEMDIPRGHFPQDVLYNLGGFKDIFNVDQIEKVFHTMADNEWAPTKQDDTSYEQSNELIALLQEISRDQIAQLIKSKFPGHRLAKLVRAIMIAKGYNTHMGSSDESGGNLDILAAKGGMGFDNNVRICILVRADDTPIATLDKFVGTMNQVGANYGLLVSWGGFKSNVEQERSNEFFTVRLWNQNDLIDQVLEHYEELDNYIKGEIPLKSFWTVSTDID